MVKTAKGIKRVEAAVQRGAVRWIYETYDGVKVVATLNENNRHCMDMGCDDGITDLILFWTPPVEPYIMHTLFLELKKSEGKLQPNQKDWAASYHEGWAANNTYYACAYGFKQVREIITCIVHQCMLKQHK